MTVRYVATIRVQDGVILLGDGRELAAAFGLSPSSVPSIPEILLSRVPLSKLEGLAVRLVRLVSRPEEFTTAEHIGTLLGDSSAEISGRWTKAICDWVAEGRVQAIEFYGDWYIAKSEVERILSAGEIVESKLSSGEAVDWILSSEMPSDLLTAGQVAEVLCASAEIVRKWIANGTLPATKVNRQWRIHKSKLGRLLEQYLKSRLARVRGALWENLGTRLLPLAECDLRHLTQKQEETPLSLGSIDDKQYWLYQGQIYSANQIYTAEEARLLIWEKKERERRKFERLRKQMKAAGHIDEARRERIPEDVRTFVWRRDGGRCVKCGSTENLEFDHIIPVSKGGSGSANNVQLLCAECNRKKSDHI